MRLFAAIRPPEHVLRHLELALDVVGGTGDGSGGAPRLRWTPGADRHVTLAFYGDVPQGAVDEVDAALARAAASSRAFDLSLRGAGVFDHRVVWIGVQGDVDALAGLVGGAVRLGEEVLGRHDPRPRSRAHLTVARLADRSGSRRVPDRAGGAADLVRAMAVYEGPRWSVEDVVLVESRPGHGRSGGPLCLDRARCPLGRFA